MELIKQVEWKQMLLQNMEHVCELLWNENYSLRQEIEALKEKNERLEQTEPREQEA